MAESFTPSLTNQSYRPYVLIATPGGYSQTANAGQRFSVTLPSKPPSAYQYDKWSRDDLYPGAVLFFESSAFNTSPDTHVKASPDPIDNTTDFRYQLLLAGFPVITVQLTTTSGDTELDLYGKGFYHAPGGQDRRWERWEDPNQQKDAILAMQYLRYHRERIIAALAEGEYGWADNYCAAGVSSGACAASEIALKPSHAFALGSEGELTMDTVPNCAVLMATNVAIPWAFVDAATWGVCLPQAETGVNAEVVAATLGAAPARYVAELGAWINMAGRNNNTIPHTYMWTDAAVAQFNGMVAGFMRNLGEPFDDDGGAVDAKWTNTAHLIATFLAQQSAWPSRIHLTGGSDLLNDQYGINTYSRLAEIVEDAYSAAELSENNARSVVNFVRKHITDKPWDKVKANLSDGIWRRGQVETIGRYCIPPHPDRKRVRICNVGNDKSVGPVADEKLLVGLGSKNIVSVIPLDEERVFPGTMPIYLKSDDAGATSYAKFGAVEEFA